MAFYICTKAVPIRKYEISKGYKYVVERLKIEDTTYCAVYAYEPETIGTDLPPILTGEALLTEEEIDTLKTQKIFTTIL